MSDPTVHLRVVIQIDVDDEIDTCVGVEEWNAMDQDTRQAIVAAVWNEAATADHGGISVATPGAVEI